MGDSILLSNEKNRLFVTRKITHTKIFENQVPQNFVGGEFSKNKMGAASTDNFCLRWNDFAENVSGAFKELRAESDFFDVTLACSDSGSKTLQAHKVILSACS